MSSLDVFLIVFGIYLIASISWSFAGYFGAPWVPTPLWVMDRMLKMAELKEGETLVDLGAGDGRIVIWAAMRYKANAIGVEIDPLRCAWSNLLILLLGLDKRAHVHYGDIHKASNLHTADIVTTYLLQSTNQKLAKKLLRECKPDVRILSRTFTYPDFKLKKQDQRRKLYLYTKN